MLAGTYRGFPRLISQYVTPLSLGGETTHRLVSLPDNVTLRQALLDVVQLLGHPEAWIQDSDTALTPDEITPIFTELARQLTEPNPMIGAIIPYMTNHLPANVLPCNGNTYNRADYPDLYNILPAGLIIDVDTFRTPDFTDRTARGTNDVTNFVGDTGGNDTITLTVDQMPSHTHSNTPHSHTFWKSLPLGIDLEGIGAPDPTAVSNTQIPENTWNATVDIHYTGGGQPVDITPQFIAVNYAIVAR